MPLSPQLRRPITLDPAPAAHPARTHRAIAQGRLWEIYAANLLTESL